MEDLLRSDDLDAGLYDSHDSRLLPCDISAMVYFEARSRRLLRRGRVFMDFGAGSRWFRGKLVPNVLEGDLFLIATSGRVTACA